MEVTPLLKPGKRKPKSSRQPNPQKQQRIVDPQAIESARREYCVKCGISRSVEHNHVHHIYTKGAGNPDAEDNLISLCVECHTKAHAGLIPKKLLKDLLQSDVIYHKALLKREGGE